MSNFPSPLMSTTEAPLHQLPAPPVFEMPVISVNLRFPRLRKSLFDVMLAVKYRSGSPSLLKSPQETPPPLYRNSISSGLMESFSVTSLMNFKPDSDEDIFSNKVLSLLQEFRQTAAEK